MQAIRPYAMAIAAVAAVALLARVGIHVAGADYCRGTCRTLVPFQEVAAGLRAAGFQGRGTIVARGDHAGGNLRVQFPRARVMETGYPPRVWPKASGSGQCLAVWTAEGNAGRDGAAAYLTGELGVDPTAPHREGVIAGPDAGLADAQLPPLLSPLRRASGRVPMSVAKTAPGAAAGERARTGALSVVVPAKNEEESLPVLVARIVEVCAASGLTLSDIVLVDDGSSDSTWAVMSQLAAGNDSDPGDPAAAQLRQGHGADGRHRRLRGRRRRHHGRRPAGRPGRDPALRADARGRLRPRVGLEEGAPRSASPRRCPRACSTP